jgi:hypothetical protein
LVGAAKTEKERRILKKYLTFRDFSVSGGGVRPDTGSGGTTLPPFR